jgi:hypothetical protein
MMIDAWSDQPLTPQTRIVDLVGRNHDLRVENPRARASPCQVRFRRLYYRRRCRTTFRRASSD